MESHCGKGFLSETTTKMETDLLRGGLWTYRTRYKESLIMSEPGRDAPQESNDLNLVLGKEEEP